MLPPVLPLVFYNGSAAWHAELDLSKMIVAPPAGLEAFQAGQRYCLIDQQRLDPVKLAGKRSLLALLFRSELSPRSDVLREVLPMLATWLGGAEQESLRRTISLWLSRLVAREFPEVSMNDALKLDDAAGPAVRKFATWSDALKDEGRQEGLAQGRAEGLAEGKAEGKAEGLHLALHALVARRFGRDAADAVCMAAAKPGTELERWIVRAAEAPDMQALFGGDAAAG